MSAKRSGESLDRKSFLRFLIGLTGSMVGGAKIFADPADAATSGSTNALPRRKLGDMGIELPVLGVGGYHMGMPTAEQKSRTLMETAIDEGIRFFDNAESYHAGKSERWMGAALLGARKDVFLMTKTHAFPERTAESAKRHLGESLERLQTNYLDLWQLHAVKTPEDVDASFRAGGAMEYILEAKEQGMVRYVGVTGHTSAEANLRALKHFDEGWRFDAFQFPCNPIDVHQRSFVRELLPEVVKRGIAVLAMKTAAAGALVDQNVCSIDECLRFVLSLPVSMVISGMASAEHVRRNASIVREAQPFTPAEADALLARIKPRATLDLESYKS